MKRAVWAGFCVLALSGAAFAQQGKNAAQPARATTGGVLGIGASKAPISIDADKLQVFDKEQRAVYSGNVVVVQGDTTMKAAHMTVFYERANQDAQPAEPGSSGPGGAALKRVEAKGDVVITSKDQVARGDNGVLDRENDRMILTGNVSLSQGENITKGEKLFYNLSTGVATVDGGRVRSLLVPGSDEAKEVKDGKKPAASAPAAAPAAKPQTPPASQQKPKS